MTIYILFLFLWLGVSLRTAIIPITIIILIVSIILFVKRRPKLFLIGSLVLILGVGLSYVRFDYQRNDFSGFVIESKENYFIILSEGEKLYTYAREHEYEVGDYLKISGEKEKIESTAIESQFDFKEYLNKKGIYYQINSKSIKTQFSIPFKNKDHKKQLLSRFNDNQKSFIQAILFSESDDSEIHDNLSYLHLSKFASATGLYLYAYISVINYFISLIFKKEKWKILSLLTLIPYFIFTFPRLTIIRIFALEIKQKNIV